MYIRSLVLGPVAANCYIICDEVSGDGAVMDPGDYSVLIEREIEKAGIKNLKYILCTHGHFDHVSGVGRLKEKHPNAQVTVGAGDEGALGSPLVGLSQYFGAPFYPCNYDIVLNDGDTLFLGDTELKIISTPGHTPGGVLYYCEKENILFTGDTLFSRSIGRTDMPGGDCFELLKSLKKFKNFPVETKIFSGHGETTDIDTELRYNPYLR